MDMSFEQKVRERAYEIWQAAGMQDGLAHEHWCAAEADVMRDAAPAAGASAKAPRATKAAAPKAATRSPAKSATKTATKNAARAKSTPVGAHLN